MTTSKYSLVGGSHPAIHFSPSLTAAIFVVLQKKTGKIG